MKMYPQPRRKATVLSVMERMRTDKSGKRNQGEFNFRDAMDERRRWKLTLIVTHVVGSVLKNSKDDVLDPSKKTKKSIRKGLKNQTTPSTSTHHDSRSRVVEGSPDTESCPELGLICNEERDGDLELVIATKRSISSGSGRGRKEEGDDATRLTGNALIVPPSDAITTATRG